MRWARLHKWRTLDGWSTRVSWTQSLDARNAWRASRRGLLHPPGRMSCRQEGGEKGYDVEVEKVEYGSNRQGDLDVIQFDVTPVWLHSTSKEEIHMGQPDRYANPRKRD